MKLREYKNGMLFSARFKAQREVDIRPKEMEGCMNLEVDRIKETPKQRAQRHLDDESYYKFSLISSIKDIIF